MEIIVVLIIIGILAAVAMSNYNTMIIQGAAQAAQNNLMTIYGAQRNYYFTNGSYCTNSCDNLKDINNQLTLNITDGYYSYTCSCAYSGTCGGSGAYCYAQLTNAPGGVTFLYETAGVPVYGVNTLTSSGMGSMSCGALSASVGLHGAACINPLGVSCPGGTTNEGPTFDCTVACCAN